MRIQVFVFDGCPNSEPTIDLVKSMAGADRPDATVEVVRIEDEDQARDVGFLGSPTVLVDGLDVEPSRRAEVGYAMTCRVYRSESGLVGIPPVEMIRAALEEAGA